MWLRATCACSVNNKWPAGVVMSIENPTCDIKTVRAGVLEVAYLEFGEANGWAVILSHGFPFDVHAYECAVSDTLRINVKWPQFGPAWQSCELRRRRVFNVSGRNELAEK
jgi:hypothetical protein